jgi:hypothetical protein
MHRDSNQARAVWPPEEGYFRMRLSKGGWPVPCRIQRTWGGWQVIINEAVSAADPDPAYVPGMERVWTSERITEAYYNYLIGVKRWAEDYGQHEHPALNPYQPIDPMRLKPLFPTKQKDPDQ